MIGYYKITPNFPIGNLILRQKRLHLRQTGFKSYHKNTFYIIRVKQVSEINQDAYELAKFKILDCAYLFLAGLLFHSRPSGQQLVDFLRIGASRDSIPVCSR